MTKVKFHFQINRSVQRIVQCYKRGEECSSAVKRSLKILHNPASDSGMKEPCTYIKVEENNRNRSEERNFKHVHPPASAEETEYQVLKFYPLSSDLDYIINQVNAWPGNSYNSLVS